MTLGLDDPRVAQLLTDMVDRRVRAAIDGMARIRYGTVAAVDSATSTASLLLGGSTTPSPGFVYEAGSPPAVGDRVRAVNRGADRYIEANLTGAADNAPWSGGERQALSCTTAASNAFTRATGGNTRWQGADVTWDTGNHWWRVNRAGVYLVLYGGRYTLPGTDVTLRVGYSHADGADPGVSAGVTNVQVIPSANNDLWSVNGAGVIQAVVDTRVSLSTAQSGTGTRSFTEGRLALIRVGAILP